MTKKEITCPYAKKDPLRVGTPHKKGVLLVNLGTPDGLGYWNLRKYLQEFLMDPRVVDVPRFIWLPILFGPILTFRPRKVSKAYARIWNDQNESPLRTFSQNQATKLQAELGKGYHVALGMRYGNPSLQDGLDELYKAGCREIILAPLYPQYSTSTVGTVVAKVNELRKDDVWLRHMDVIRPYYDHPMYIDLMAKSVENHLKKLDWTPDVLLTSFHGIPKDYVTKKGDPYFCHSHKTARLVAEKLGWEFIPDWRDVDFKDLKKPAKNNKPKLCLTFQSRFGPKEWLQPYTDETLEKFAHKGITKLAIMAPGFSVDCLETLDELNIEGKEEFMNAGGEKFTYIPCLNDEDDAIKLIKELLPL